jgi:hypothetical protein
MQRRFDTLKVRPIGCPETSTTNLRCLTPQRSEALIDTAVEAQNHASVKVILFSGVECEIVGSRAACRSSDPFGDPRNFSKQAANTAQR